MLQQLQNFLIQPTIQKPKSFPIRHFLTLLLIDIFLTGICLSFFQIIGFDNRAYFKLTLEEIQEIKGFLIATAILLAPPMEEFFFRYYLNYNTKNLWISAILLFLAFIVAFDSAAPLGNSIYFLSAAFVITMLMLKELFGYTSAKILIWGSILSFGLYHLPNYDSEAYSHNYLIIPLLILPQLIGGFFLAFVRIHYRFIHCILFHAAFNLLVITVSELMA